MRRPYSDASGSPDRFPVTASRDGRATHASPLQRRKRFTRPISSHGFEGWAGDACVAPTASQTVHKTDFQSRLRGTGGRRVRRPYSVANGSQDRFPATASRDGRATRASPLQRRKRSTRLIFSHGFEGRAGDACVTPTASQAVHKTDFQSRLRGTGGRRMRRPYSVANGSQDRFPVTASRDRRGEACLARALFLTSKYFDKCLNAAPDIAIVCPQFVYLNPQ